MTKTRSIYALAASAGVALALLAGTGAAQARDVNWSVGIGVPGVVVGASNGYYAPAPTYYAPPPPVYYAPPRPVYYAPAPAYYAPPPVVYYGDRGYRHHRHHDHGHRGHGHNRHWDR
ncbi:hypothetical protein ASE39_14940 [Acidovorax sp. Root267]|uniref:hypothetical protein n=1 Tax=unclassified Acidovorax TaxID=2684926 RepID=UPI00070FA61F|nr:MULTISPECIES: hypothetical protein [unclassified Acidovorax]KRD15277.1 hypothetical protein ASE39_14940 [Acidovorax sp. Root267]MBD9394413.1 hypothetical protein [Acidovorax sp. ACV01]